MNTLAGAGDELLAVDVQAGLTVEHEEGATAGRRDGGLATARREGRAVLYVRTPLGDALVAA